MENMFKKFPFNDQTFKDLVVLNPEQKHQSVLQQVS